jgi:hypothetical protein
LDDGGYGTSAAPIYQLFVEKALSLDPRYAVFVTPSRWMAGGKGLDKYRERMLSDKHLRNIVDYPKLERSSPTRSRAQTMAPVRHDCRGASARKSCGSGTTREA